MCGAPVSQSAAPISTAGGGGAALYDMGNIPQPPVYQQPVYQDPMYAQQQGYGPGVGAAGSLIQGRLIIQGTNATLPFPGGKYELFVGREDPVSGFFPELDLTNHGGDEGGVSRKHARIFMQGNQVVVEDLNSVNFTFVNQQKLNPHQPHPLNNGDELRFGRVKTIFYA